MSFTRWACLSCPRKITSVCHTSINTNTNGEQNELSNKEMEIVRISYQPLPVALGAIQIEEFNSDGLSGQGGPEIVIDEALVDGAEPTFSEEVRGGKALGN